jgi:hypothetical protein
MLSSAKFILGKLVFLRLQRLMLHHGNLSVFLRPSTREPKADFGTGPFLQPLVLNLIPRLARGLWLGRAVSLNLDALEEGGGTGSGISQAGKPAPASATAGAAASAQPALAQPLKLSLPRAFSLSCLLLLFYRSMLILFDPQPRTPLFRHAAHRVLPTRPVLRTVPPAAMWRSNCYHLARS